MAPNLCGHILHICIYVLCTQSTSGCDKLADNLFFRLLSQIFGHIHLLALGTMTEKDLPLRRSSISFSSSVNDL